MVRVSEGGDAHYLHGCHWPDRGSLASSHFYALSPTMPGENAVERDDGGAWGHRRIVARFERARRRPRQVTGWRRRMVRAGHCSWSSSQVTSARKNPDTAPPTAAAVIVL